MPLVQDVTSTAHLELRGDTGIDESNSKSLPRQRRRARFTPEMQAEAAKVRRIRACAACYIGKDGCVHVLARAALDTSERNLTDEVPDDTRSRSAFQEYVVHDSTVMDDTGSGLNYMSAETARKYSYIVREFTTRTAQKSESYRGRVDWSAPPFSVRTASDNGSRRVPERRTPSGPRHQWDYALGAPKTRRQNKRKVLRVLLDGQEHLACPDSGSEKNIMSQNLANDLNLRIRNGPQDIKRFEIGNGKCIFSIGRVRVPVKLPGSSLGRKKRWIYVLQNCPVPLILGMPFLQEAEILTKNRDLLVTCPQEFSNISSLLWIGSPRQRMKCSLDGRNLVTVADTGSDLNLMSLNCAKREGFFIDRRREARRRIRVGDGTEAETIGQVYVHNLGLDWREAETEVLDDPARISDNFLPAASDAEALYDNPLSFGAIFHILPGLPCDIIFGHDLLEETDAFNRCPDPFASHLADNGNLLELKILINLGPVSTFCGSMFKRRRSTPPALTVEQIHDGQHSAEMYRRSKRRMAILAMPLGERTAAEAVERRTAQRYDRLHAACVYCHPPSY